MILRSPLRGLAVLATLTVPLVGCAPGDAPVEPSSTESATATATTTASESGGTASTADCDSTTEAEFPDVVDAMLEPTGDGAYSVSATLCSAYDTPERYADAWRVLDPDDEVLGVRELLHDHAGEQPFTRSLGDPIELPDGVATVTVEGRDRANGWGGGTIEVPVP